MRWLIAEDDRALGTFLVRALANAEVEVELAHDGDDAFTSFLNCEPDLLILDLDLPTRSGTEVLVAVREISPLCPVLILSGRADDQTRIACLNLGADDCLQKPFSLGELRARCASLIRRHKALGAMLAGASTRRTQDSALRCGALEVDRYARQVSIEGERMHLTNREFALLEQLLLANNAFVSRSDLRDRLWGTQAVEAGVVDVHLAALRRKLGAHAGAPSIETVRGQGFRLQSPVAPAYARGSGFVQTGMAHA